MPSKLSTSSPPPAIRSMPSTPIQTNKKEMTPAFMVQHHMFVNTFWKYITEFFHHMRKQEPFDDKKLCVILDFEGTIVPATGAPKARCYISALELMMQMMHVGVAIFLMTNKSPAHMFSFMKENGIQQNEDGECIYNSHPIITRILYTDSTKANTQSRETNKIDMLEAAALLANLNASSSPPSSPSSSPDSKKRKCDNLYTPTPYEQYITQKNECRKDLVLDGYLILGCVGDALSDMHRTFRSPNITQNILLPNPFSIIKY